MSENQLYPFEQKEKLARRIQKLNKRKYFADIEEIITQYNPELDMMANPSGKFMYFQDLNNETYYVLEKYLRYIKNNCDNSYSNNCSNNINKHDSNNNNTETSENAYLSSENIKYSYEEEPYINEPRLRYSNKERNLIKRKIYEKQINEQMMEDSLENETNSTKCILVAKSPKNIKNKKCIKNNNTIDEDNITNTENINNINNVNSMINTNETNKQTIIVDLDRVNNANIIDTLNTNDIHTNNIFVKKNTETTKPKKNKKIEKF